MKKDIVVSASVVSASVPTIDKNVGTEADTTMS